MTPGYAAPRNMEITNHLWSQTGAKRVDLQSVWRTVRDGAGQCKTAYSALTDMPANRTDNVRATWCCAQGAASEHRLPTVRGGAARCQANGRSIGQRGAGHMHCSVAPWTRRPTTRRRMAGRRRPLAAVSASTRQRVIGRSPDHLWPQMGAIGVDLLHNDEVVGDAGHARTVSPSREGYSFGRHEPPGAKRVDLQGASGWSSRVCLDDRAAWSSTMPTV